MANIHHGTFSYSVWPTARDLLPESLSEDVAPPLVEDLTAAEKFQELESVFLNALKTPSDTHSSALPILSFSPIHALALGLQPFEEEPLQALAFGNISPDNYIDLFWEIAKEQKEASWGKLAIYEAEESSEPRFLVSFKTQLFEIRYIRCDVLTREYQKVSDAPDEFLQDPQNNIDEPIQDAVKMIRKGPAIWTHLNKYPSIRTAYSYIKRWAAIRGFTKALPDNRVFKSLQTYQIQNPNIIALGQAGDPSSSALIAEFFKQDGHKIDSIPPPTDYQSFNTKGWENFLVKLNSLPLNKKLDSPHTIRVVTTYSGISPIKGAQWLLVVQRKLNRLKERLEQSISNNLTVQIWPQRLVSENAVVRDNILENHFVLAFRPGLANEESALRLAQDIAESWRQGIEKDKTTLQGQCFLRIVFDNLPPGLRTCERKWPRVMLTVDNTKNSSDSEGESPPPSKKKLSKATPASSTDAPQASYTKAKRFRTASEVLNRLKFDDSYNIDEWAIGYLDRVRDKILEKPASEWDRETTAEEFIPEHRIEHFKRYTAGGKWVEGEERGEIMWSKRQKLDKIFKVE